MAPDKFFYDTLRHIDSFHFHGVSDIKRPIIKETKNNYRQNITSNLNKRTPTKVFILNATEEHSNSSDELDLLEKILNAIPIKLNQAKFINLPFNESELKKTFFEEIDLIDTKYIFFMGEKISFTLLGENANHHYWNDLTVQDRTFTTLTLKSLGSMLCSVDCKKTTWSRLKEFQAQN